MKKFYTLAFILFASHSFGQAFAVTYNFASVASASSTTVTSVTDPTIVPTATGVAFGSFSAVNPNGTTSNGTGRLATTNQPLGATDSNDILFTGAIDLAVYHQVTITPQAVYSMSLSSIVFGMRRGTTGVRNYAVRSSADGYASNLAASINPTNTNLTVDGSNNFFWTLDATSTSADQAGSTVTLSGSSFTEITTPITFRFYAWNAEVTTGNFSIDNVVVTGSSTSTLGVQQNEISGLSMYPNPVTNGNLYITSTSNQAKSVAIFDILGKQVVKASTVNNTVNVTNLKAGVYIVKITEGEKTDSRKLIIE